MAETTDALRQETTETTIDSLLAAGLHFGHQTRRWNPKMKKFIFGKKNGIHIIDLHQTLTGLNKALEYIHNTVAAGRFILFVGTKKQAQLAVKDAATAAEQPYVVTRWLGGTLTNKETIDKRIACMKTMQAETTNGTVAALSKRDASLHRHEREKLEKNLSGLAHMNVTPGALFIVDINREAIAVAEANRVGIPVIAIVDSNCDPDKVQHVIPGNDDSIRAVQAILAAVGKTMQAARGEWAIRAKAEADAKARAAAEGGASSTPTDAPTTATTEKPRRRSTRPGEGAGQRKRGPGGPGARRGTGKTGSAKAAVSATSGGEPKAETAKA